MPTLNWIGKDAVIKHHKEVPYRLLEPDAALSLPGLDGAGEGNLIVEGDNLHALKALLPRYAGPVGPDKIIPAPAKVIALELLRLPHHLPPNSHSSLSLADGLSLVC
jgi:hypothetical protein